MSAKESAEYRGDNSSLTYKQKFDFDRFGNLYRKTASNPTAGQANPIAYTPIEDADISKSTNRLTTGTTYNDAGQVVNDTKFRQMSFAYDANGRQVKATRANVPDAQTVYDASGNRVATKINDVWQYVIYDAFGKLVAEYGVASEGLGGVKYIQQDWQGSVRTTTNSNGFVVARTDHQAFGEDVGYGVGQRSVDQGYNVGKVARQGYGSTENDQASGQQHTWFRKLETSAGRWTGPDPYKGSMRIFNPQSFNRYAYVTNDPINYIDPTGLYEACVHEAMTKFLARLAGYGHLTANALGRFAGGGRGGADSFRYAATSPHNIAKAAIGRGPSVDVHFASEERLARRIARFYSDLDLTRPANNQSAGFTLHAIQDVHGAHQGYSLPLGHAPSPGTDRIIGDSRFMRAANETYQVLLADIGVKLSPNQTNKLIDAILEGCGKKSEKFKITRPPQEGGGGGDVGGGGGYIGGGGYPWWYYSTWAFANWVSSIRTYVGEEPIIVAVQDA